MRQSTKHLLASLIPHIIAVIPLISSLSPRPSNLPFAKYNSYYTTYNNSTCSVLIKLSYTAYSMILHLPYIPCMAHGMTKSSFTTHMQNSPQRNTLRKWSIGVSDPAHFYTLLSNIGFHPVTVRVITPSLVCPWVSVHVVNRYPTSVSSEKVNRLKWV